MNIINDNLTWTWNIVTESSSICIRIASFLPPRWWGVDGVPSTPDGVLKECVIREPGIVFVGPIESKDIFVYRFSFQIISKLINLKWKIKRKTKMEFVVAVFFGRKALWICVVSGKLGWYGVNASSLRQCQKSVIWKKERKSLIKFVIKRLWLISGEKTIYWIWLLNAHNAHNNISKDGSIPKPMTRNHINKNIDVVIIEKSHKLLFLPSTSKSNNKYI